MIREEEKQKRDGGRVGRYFFTVCSEGKVEPITIASIICPGSKVTINCLRETFNSLRRAHLNFSFIAWAGGWIDYVDRKG